MATGWTRPDGPPPQGRRRARAKSRGDAGGVVEGRRWGAPPRRAGHDSRVPLGACATPRGPCAVCEMQRLFVREPRADGDRGSAAPPLGGVGLALAALDMAWMILHGTVEEDVVYERMSAMWDVVLWRPLSSEIVWYVRRSYAGSSVAGAPTVARPTAKQLETHYRYHHAPRGDLLPTSADAEVYVEASRVRARLPTT